MKDTDTQEFAHTLSLSMRTHSVYVCLHGGVSVNLFFFWAGCLSCFCGSLVGKDIVVLQHDVEAFFFAGMDIGVVQYDVEAVYLLNGHPLPM